jgi:hypothetical protein
MNWFESTQEERKTKNEKKNKKKKDCRESTGKLIQTEKQDRRESKGNKSIEMEKQKPEETHKNHDGFVKMLRRSSCASAYSPAKATHFADGTSDSISKYLHSSSGSIGTVSTAASSLSGSSHSSSSDRRRQQRRLSCSSQTYISVTTVELISEDAGIKW